MGALSGFTFFFLLRYEQQANRKMGIHSQRQQQQQHACRKNFCLTHTHTLIQNPNTTTTMKKQIIKLSKFIN